MVSARGHGPQFSSRGLFLIARRCGSLFTWWGGSVRRASYVTRSSCRLWGRISSSGVTSSRSSLTSSSFQDSYLLGSLSPSLWSVVSLHRSDTSDHRSLGRSEHGCSVRQHRREHEAQCYFMGSYGVNRRKFTFLSADIFDFTARLLDFTYTVSPEKSHCLLT
jgi:hypothetical protein